MENVKRVLLIDDDPDDRSLFCESLAELYPHFYCELVKDGRQFFTLISQQTVYDYIFIDLNLPTMDGFQILEIIRDNKLVQESKLIILSSTSRQSDIDRCNKLGAAGFFTKPSTYGMLGTIMKAAFDIPSPEKSAE